MSSCMKSAVVFALTLTLVGTTAAAQWYAAPDGKRDAKGTADAPWDLDSALAGRQKVEPGDTLWLQAGTYRHPDRSLGSPGFVVRLAGKEGRPIHVRAVAGKRATIDGGLCVQAPADWLWIRDLEILVSENSSMSRVLKEPGSHPKSYDRPWGGLSIHSGRGCKYVNLVIHDNAQGVSWWKDSTGSEIHGCIIYDNGWEAPDRGHGHAIYTQNQDGTKTISDCIMTGGYGYSLHAYGSSRAYVDNYLVEGNICYKAGQFLIGGGRPSRNIHAVANYLHGSTMRIGYSAPHNEDCLIRDNIIVDGDLQINNYRKVVRQDNLVLGKNDPRPADDARVILRPNRYDPRRANVAIFNWAKRPSVAIRPDRFLNSGDKFRLMDPTSFFGEPLAAGTFDGRPIPVPLDGEFAAFVLLKD